MNEKQFFDKLTTMFQILEHRLTVEECKDLGFYPISDYAENKLEELTYPE
jgi:hypothetical protein